MGDPLFYLTQPPSRAGFLAWIRAVMGVPPQYLPDSWPAIDWAYTVSYETVNKNFSVLQPPLWAQAVYLLGGNNLIVFAPDVTDDGNGDPIFFKEVGPNQEPVGYFEYYRRLYGTNAFRAGVISGSNDQATGMTLEIPDVMKNLSFADLQATKTPWGQEYLGMAQAYGTNWGFTR